VADGDPARVLVVGEALVDVRLRADSRTEHPGGSPLNIAVGLARLGLPTTLGAQVGDDTHGSVVTAHLQHSGVELLRLPPHHDTATATATLRDNGSATYDFDITWNPVRLPDPAGFGLVHVGSIGATLLPGAGAVRGLVRAAVSAGVPVSIDPNVRPSLTPDIDQVRVLVEEMLELASVVKLSDEDAEVLWPGQALDEVVAALAGAPSDPLVAVTRGGEGAVLAAGKWRQEVAAPPVEVADTIGAGDSFMSALLAGLLHHDLLSPRTLAADESAGDTLAWLGAVAIEAAAVTCSRPGADPPWADELPALAGGPGTDPVAVSSRR
jgi:fructokinase